MVAPIRSPRSAARPAAPATAPFRKRRPYRSDQTVGAMVVAFVVAMLLGSQSLVNLAGQQPYGARRTVLLGMAKGLHSFSHALLLDQPAAKLGALTGKEPPVRVDVEAVVQQQAVTPPTTPSTIPLEVNPATGKRYVTAEEPLRVLLAGDSMMRELGGALMDTADGRLTEVTLDYRVSSGLSRPDYFDWPSRLATKLDELDPEAVVLMFGANDHQDVEIDGEILRADSPEWLAEYGRRVGLVMDLLHRGDMTVTWVALPPMRAADFSAAMASLSDVYRREAERRPWVHVVDGGAGVAAPDGSFAAYLPGGDGAPVVLRQEDGVHYSTAGAARAAASVWQDVVGRWGLDEAAATLASGG